MAGRSRMSQEVHVRFCEGLGVRSPQPTRLINLNVECQISNTVSNRRAPTCGARYIRKNQMSCDKGIDFLRVLILRRSN